MGIKVEPKLNFGEEIVGQIESLNVRAGLVQQNEKVVVLGGERGNDAANLSNNEREQEERQHVRHGREKVLVLGDRLRIAADCRGRLQTEEVGEHVAFVVLVLIRDRILAEM